MTSEWRVRQAARHLRLAPYDVEMQRRYRLTVRYDGFEFHGWQKQGCEEQPLRTAQGVLESAVSRAVRQPVTLIGASRTDAGVHALGQVAAFTAETTIPAERLHDAINRFLPEDIAVAAAREVEPGFDPIAMAQRKAYRYTIHNASVRPVFERHRVYHCWHALDERAMHAAAQHLVGTHDFASFANAHHGRDSTVRTIFSCSVDRQGERLTMDVCGSGFLYHMVRIIIGTLVEVGRGALAVEQVPRILAARDRAQAGPTLDAAGLCLMWIRYPGDEAGGDAGDGLHNAVV